MTIRTILIIAALGGTLAGAAGDARAQHGGHGAGASSDACDRELERAVADGRGFGMANAADRHGYPGPLHVLELATRLELTASQTSAVRALQDGMFAESRPRGAALLDAERRLEALFASGRADEAAVRSAVGDVERRRAELRTVHLATHVKTAALLTPEQRRAYHVLRWGAR